MLALSGASGLVGRYLCEQLVSSGTPFKILGRNKPSTLPLNLVPFCFYDLRTPPSDSVMAFLRDVDVLINLAALLPSTLIHTSDYFYCNSIAPKSLFDLCAQVGVDKFIHLSSANFLQPQDGRVSSYSSYSHCLRQPSYLSSKIAGELLLLNTDCNTKLFIVRPSSIFGYGIRSGIFRSFYDSFARSQPVTLTHNGLWSADFIYAGDVAKCLFGLLNDMPPSILNIGSGCVTTIHSVAKSLARLTGASEDLICLEYAQDHSDSIGSLPAVSCDDKFVSLLGRLPFSVNEGLNHALTTYGAL